ncbi:MAG: radical SAM protein, partial [Clostridiales bacterium]|nr:radical SAM protein [Clostridiales bacterium]
MPTDGVFIGAAESICPVCLDRIPASKVRAGDDVYMEKECPEHGSFRTILWRGKPSYEDWYSSKSPEKPDKTNTPINKGCPFDCGLCPSHKQQSCCVLLEVTGRCNLSCPFCFASAGEANTSCVSFNNDPTLQELRICLQNLMDSAGACNLQLSGGEPTVRDDLPEIISMAKEMGFSFIQLNTNGIRLAVDAGYAAELGKAGLSVVFLQFDGTRDDINIKIRGRKLLDEKIAAVENCSKSGLGVVLVPTLIPGVNADNIGDMIRFGADRQPTVRGIHFQPVSYFGRFPESPSDDQRLTLPEVMRAIEKQTDGSLKVENFVPSGCESTLCSFHGDFLMTKDEKPVPLSRKTETSSCCSGTESSVIKARNYVSRRWIKSGDKAENKVKVFEADSLSPDSWDIFLEKLRNNRFSIT